MQSNRCLTKRKAGSSWLDGGRNPLSDPPDPGRWPQTLSDAECGLPQVLISRAVTHRILRSSGRPTTS